MKDLYHVLDKYDISEEVLGEGAFAVVKTCKIRTSDQMCAVKVSLIDHAYEHDDH